jgi:formylglycine-generating enzyme required for sulfatase activity
MSRQVLTRYHIIVLSFILSLPLMLLGCSSPPEGMIKIPAGEFIMGSDEVDTEGKAIQYGSKKPWFLNEHPSHKVTTKEYYMDKTEVTNMAYQKFVADSGHEQPQYWSGGSYPSGTDNHPVLLVSWFDAKGYCDWAGKRLPTETEWEKAARGTDGRRYPWGDEFDIEKLNSHGVKGNTVEVGSSPSGASPYGLVDMAGNVHEWVENAYKPYEGNTYEDDDFGELFKVLRGGGWGGVGHYYSQINVRTTQRSHAPPGGKYNDVGFRCAW